MKLNREGIVVTADGRLTFESVANEMYEIIGVYKAWGALNYILGIGGI